MKFWNRKRDDIPEDDGDGMTPIYVPMAMLLRSVVYDAGFDNPEVVMHAMGLQGISPEVGEMEEAASERRLDAIEPLGPFLHLSSMFLAKATVAYATSEMPGGVPEEMRDALAGQFQRLALGSAVCSLASLVDMGLVSINGAAIGLGPAPESFDPTDLTWGHEDEQ